LVAEAWKLPLQPNIHLLPEALQATVFDIQVNAGGNAIKILQRLLGPYTAAAVQRIYDEAGAYLVTAAQPHGNTLEPAEAGRVVGSNELKSSCNQSIT
jgi:lysozyme family protein